MTSSKPYLIRAIYEWLVDNRLTPYILVDALQPHVVVPERYIDEGKIVLNIAPQAVVGLLMSNSAVEFDARFSGNKMHVYIPISAVKAIYAFENGRGMVFSDDEDSGGDIASDKQSSKKDKSPQKKGRPDLKIVK